MTDTVTEARARCLKPVPPVWRPRRQQPEAQPVLAPDDAWQYPLDHCLYCKRPEAGNRSCDEACLGCGTHWMTNTIPSVRVIDSIPEGLKPRGAR